ncbi:MAG: TolC family protein [Bacteroides sp.]|nr:TolC family protein [Bacteroides sp.]
MKKYISAIFLSLALASAVAQGSIYDAVVTQILDNNPDIASQAALTTSEKASLLPDNNLDDPELEYTHEFGQYGIGNKWSIGASQSFDWPSVYSSRSKAIAATASAMDLRDAAKVAEVRLAIQTAVIDWIYYRKLVGIYSKQLSMTDSLIAVYQKGIESKDVSVLDYNKLKLERINISSRLNEAYSSSVEALGRLQVFNGGNDCSAMLEQITDFPSEPLLPLDEYLLLAAAGNPSLRYANAMLHAENLNLQTERRSLLPSFLLGYVHEYEMGDHFNGFSVSMTLPFLSRRHRTEAVKARQLAVDTERMSLESTIAASIASDYRLVEIYDKEIAEYGAVLADDSNLRLLNIALEARHIPLIDYLAEVNFFTEAQTTLLGVIYKRELLMTKINAAI